MNKFNKKITDIIKNMDGNVLGIGIENEHFISALDKNNKITICNLMNLNAGKGKISSGKKNKTINIKKIRKKFKKKRVDYIICNINDIKDFTKTFVKDSVYINKNKLYIYGDTSYDYELLVKKYKRYNTNINIDVDDSKFILTIDNSLSKTNFIKDTIYLIIDTINNLINLITNVLTS